MYKLFRSFIFISISLFVFANDAEAWTPEFEATEVAKKVYVIDNPTSVRAFHGDLDNEPHTYEITVDDPITLNVEILVPDIKSSTNNISAIIVKKSEELHGRVTEVTRMRSESASWDETEFKASVGESYRKGPTFNKELEEGTYRIEVHTPDNIEKYVLLIGTNDDISVGYFKFLGRLIDTKQFFEKTPLMIVQSPYVYIPLLIIFIAVFVYRRMKRNDII